MVPNGDVDQRASYYKDGYRATLFGKSRIAYYDRKNHLKAVNQDEIIVLDMVAQIRRELPGLDCISYTDVYTRL